MCNTYQSPGGYSSDMVVRQVDGGEEGKTQVLKVKVNKEVVTSIEL